MRQPWTVTFVSTVKQFVYRIITDIISTIRFISLITSSSLQVVAIAISSWISCCMGSLSVSGFWQSVFSYGVWVSPSCWFNSSSYNFSPGLNPVKLIGTSFLRFISRKQDHLFSQVEDLYRLAHIKRNISPPLPMVTASQEKRAGFSYCHKIPRITSGCVTVTGPPLGNLLPEPGYHRTI